MKSPKNLNNNKETSWKPLTVPTEPSCYVWWSYETRPTGTLELFGEVESVLQLPRLELR